MPRFASALLNWYAKNKRILPWRGQTSAYAVLVSEFMLQQTRVETVIPYYKKWLKLFPSFRALARADEREVLSAWEGLGYYSRARNLHKAAQFIVQNYNGKLPRDLAELQKLPGVGQYTAGALASIVFGMDEPALDGNLKRVFSRIFDMDLPIDSTEGEKRLWKFARESLPKGNAAEFNQALMDLGAMVCLPKNPRCEICPVKAYCLARKNRSQHLRPLKKVKKMIPYHIHATAVIVRRGRVLLAQRPPGGLLAGMWEFPNARVEGDLAAGLVSALRAAYSLKVRMKRGVRPFAVMEHSYSHFKITVHAFRCETSSKAMGDNLKWVRLKDLEKYPMGKIDRQIAQKF